MTHMTDDYYIYDEATYSMTGKHSGRRVRLGDKVEIEVLSVNLEKREIDFTLLEDPDFEPFFPDVRESSQPDKKRNRKSGRRKKNNR